MAHELVYIAPPCERTNSRARQSAGSSARKDLENGKQSVAELFVKVREIKGKAEQSEQMVHEICRDIKSLDYAKRHLTTTITALKRLHMLLTAVEQLSATAGEKQYREAANLLDAVRQQLRAHALGVATLDARVMRHVR